MRLTLPLCLLLYSASVWAQQPAPKPEAPKAAVAKPDAKPDERAELVKKLPGLKLEDVRKSPIDGIYELSRGAEVAYVSGNGRYLIAGDLIDLDADANLSENRRRAIRSRLLETIPDSDMLVFSPKDPKYTITVFTDIDCGYCQQLHSQIADYNRLGVKVRYLFYPRAGPGSDSWRKAENVWCSINRNDALTRAKRGEEIKAAKCPADAVARDYEMGRKLALEGTPAIFLSSGELVAGYLPPGQLAMRLRAGNEK